MTKMVCAILTLLSGIVFSVDIKAEQVGDMNADGQVDTTEAIISLKIAAGQDPGVPLGTYIPATGNAVAAHVLTGKTFSNSSNSGVTGTMPNNTASTIIPGTTAQTIPEGYHSGQGTVGGDQDLVAEKIKFGVEIFGVVGIGGLPKGCYTYDGMSWFWDLNYCDNAGCIETSNPPACQTYCEALAMIWGPDGRLDPLLVQEHCSTTFLRHPMPGEPP